MIRIGSTVLRVDDLQRQTEFWEAALGYVRRDSGESDDFVLLGPPDGAPEVWSVYGAERSQPVATGGRWDDLESGSDTRKPLPWVATSCPDPKMVRRGRRFESVRGLFVFARVVPFSPPATVGSFNVHAGSTARSLARLELLRHPWCG
jgi:catechol 2,3-dioxygenase-like lactoylglutathione lyase family enzyme